VISSRINNAFSKMGGLLVLMAFVLSICLTTHLSAQELSGTKGGLQGVVTDSSGAVIPGATVTVIGASDTRKLTTDTAGHWVAIDLTPGPYTISVEREGFSKTQTKSIDAEINRINGVNLVLKTGAVAETVQVDATATSIDTGTTALSSNLTASFYSQVPVARDVGSLFYTAPGVTNSGGTGTANPSVDGATGLENQYIADGVNITDGGYGGIGVYSPIYGSLGTGINLTFIQEVQVKTGAFEPKYGNMDGGIVQIVTKSGGTGYHGALAAFFAPDGMTAGQRYADDYFDRSNVHGHISSIPQFDASAEIGGYVPGEHLKDKLFFFGAYNPALNKVLWLAPSVATLYSHGVYNNKTTVNSYAAKVTYKLNDATSVDASVFSDPSKTNAGYGVANQDTFPFFPNLNLNNETGFSRWSYGTRSETLHISSSITPTWQLDITGSAKRSHFDEVGLQDAYQVVDYSGAVQAGNFTAQGLGYTQNPTTHDYGFSIDTEKTVGFHGQHTFSVGFGFEHSIYALTKAYSGGYFTFPSQNIAGISALDYGGTPGLIGATANAAFTLNSAADPNTGVVTCSPSDCPYYNGVQVYLHQSRGIFSSPVAETSSGNLAIYGNDNYQITKKITLNIGLRWDEEQLNAVTQSFVFNDNWSPRLGINYDPFGDRKSKIFFNWGRYTQSFPQDGALRDLSNEFDINGANWKPEADANNNVILNSNNSVNPILDAAHLISGDPAAGAQGSAISASGGASPIFIAPRTKQNYEEEYVAGIERQFGGFDVSARYMDRRLLRIIEDSSGVSPEAALGGVLQQFVVGNLNASTDLFVNGQEQPYTFDANSPTLGAPDTCVTNLNIANGNSAFLGSDGAVAGPGGACISNSDTAGTPTPDGVSDGFSNPRRHYQALELEANKSLSHNFMVRVNYRYAKLFGNYEGLYRNDNGQSDPSISSLFDFTNGVLGMLGAQFSRGYLNTDRRQVGNLYGSYVVPNGFMKGFTGGIGLRGSAGTPISKLGAHPAYTDPGEIPLGGRGNVGTTASNYQLDLHADYPLRLGERYKLKLTFDTFNVTNSRSLTAVDQNVATSYTVPNVDYLKPLSFQRAFYGRGSIRFEF
jgi:outer membrane receptor protein involved in Fe transport